MKGASNQSNGLPGKSLHPSAQQLHLVDQLGSWGSAAATPRIGRRNASTPSRSPGDFHHPVPRGQGHVVVADAADAPVVLKEDFYNSLLAAYTVTEIEE